jgi:general secretion pathway protein D
VVNHRPGVRGRVVAGLAGLVACLAVCLAACDPVSLSDRVSRAPDPFDSIRNLDLTPRFPQPSGTTGPPPQVPRGDSYFGREQTMEPAPPAQASSDGEGYELNFENAAVTTVAKVILGDILGVGYTIDPRIQGTVTIASGRPVPKGDLVYVLENALRMSNVVLVPETGAYRLIPAGEASGNGRLTTAKAGGDEPGYGLTVVPLRYTSAPTILKLLDSFALKPGAARVDPARNLILIQGSGPERRAAMETILSFDVDWMRGQSVGIYPVQNSAPEAMISELEKIMESGEGGLNQSMVKFQPIARLNAVLVVTKQPNLLRVASTWITRLDKSNTAGAGVRVFRLRYGDAKVIAGLLNDIFGTRAAGGLESAVSQIAPGAGVTATSSTDQLAAPGGPPSGAPRTSTLDMGQGLAQVGRSLGVGATSQSTSVTSSFDQRFGGTTAVTSTLAPPGAAPGGVAGMAGAGGRAGQAAAFELAGGVRITADISNNSLVIYANQEHYKLIEQTIAQLDRPQLQVAIHATIAEITLNNDLRYGIQYFIQSSDVGMARDKGSFSLINPVGPTSSTTSATGAVTGIAAQVLGRVLPGFNLLLGPEATPRVILDALRTVTDVKVLSTPSVVVVDNQVATLVVGDQVPISTQQATILTNPNTPLINTVDYRNTGVILRVAPRVNLNGNVLLNIEQEISNVVNTGNTAGGPGGVNLTPTISQRKVKSQVAVASGQSVLLGGLIQEQQNRDRQGIPIVEEIPVLGEAFARNDRGTRRTELVIFIQPQIIRDSVDAYKVAEELRTKLKGSAETSFPPGPNLRRDPLLVR